MTNFNNTKVREWNRKVLNAYWLFFILVVISQSVTFFINRFTDPGFSPAMFLSKTVPLLALLLLILLGTEGFLRIRSIMNSYIMVTLGLFMAAAIIFASSPDVHNVYMVQMLPILVAMFYYKKGLIMFACCMDIIIFCSFYFLDPVRRAFVSPYEFATVICLFAGLYFCGTAIMKKGFELLENLESTLKSEKDLLIKSAIMDHTTKIDALTGLYNHKTFHEYMEKIFEQSEANKLLIQLAIVDVDDFKKINDSYGHLVGDLAITRVAEAIKTTIGPNDIAARYGGDEFAIIFTEKSIKEAYRITESIRERIASIHDLGIGGCHVTVSIGLQEYNRGTGKEATFRSADSALYMAKESGKNKTVIGNVYNSCSDAVY